MHTLRVLTAPKKKSILPDQTVLVSIAKEEIDNAQGKCPIVNFFEKTFPDCKVKVLRSSIQIFPRRGNQGLYGKLPWEVVEAITNKDNGIGYSALSFSVDLKN